MTSQQPMHGVSASATATLPTPSTLKDSRTLSEHSVAARSICRSPGASSIQRTRNFLTICGAGSLSKMVGRLLMRWALPLAPMGVNLPRTSWLH